MNEQQTLELLERLGDSVEVEQPRVAATLAEGRLRQRRRRGGRVVGAAAIVAIAITASVIIRPPADTGSAPATGNRRAGDGIGHSTLPPEVLELRGKAVGEALSLPEYPTGQGALDACDAPFTEYVDGHGFCVDLGSVPDEWLVSLLIMNSDGGPDRGLLRAAGIAWTADLPPPPPVIVDLLTRHLHEVEERSGLASSEYRAALILLKMAQAEWTASGGSGWVAASWNDHYWGDPWWPTADNENTSVLDLVDGLRGKALGRALGLEPQATLRRPCQEFAEFESGVGFCLDSLDLPPAEIDWLADQIADET